MNRVKMTENTARWLEKQLERDEQRRRDRAETMRALRACRRMARREASKTPWEKAHETGQIRKA